MTEQRVRRTLATASFSVAALFAFASPANAADGCSESSASTPDCTVEVKPVVIESSDPGDGGQPSTVNPSTPASPQVAPSQQLPVTGSEAGTLAAFGAVLTAAGVVLVRKTGATSESAQ